MRPPLLSSGKSFAVDAYTDFRPWKFQTALPSDSHAQRCLEKRAAALIPFGVQRMMRFAQTRVKVPLVSHGLTTVLKAQLSLVV